MPWVVWCGVPEVLIQRLRAYSGESAVEGMAPIPTPSPRGRVMEQAAAGGTAKDSSTTPVCPPPPSAPVLANALQSKPIDLTTQSTAATPAASPHMHPLPTPPTATATPGRVPLRPSQIHNTASSSSSLTKPKPPPATTAKFAAMTISSAVKHFKPPPTTTLLNKDRRNLTTTQNKDKENA